MQNLLHVRSCVGHVVKFSSKNSNKQENNNEVQNLHQKVIIRHIFEGELMLIGYYF